MPRLCRCAPILALMVPVALSAQSPGLAPRVLEVPASTRAMALGNAYMMNAGHADAIFYHPALLVDAGGFGLDVQTWSGEATAAAASGAVEWLGGGVGIGLQTLQYGAPATGLEVLPGGQDALFQVQPAPTSERVAVLGYARRVLGVQVGVAGKVVEERVSGARDAIGLLDLGVASDVGPFTAALTVQNLGKSLELGEEGSPDAPERVTLGIGAYGKPVGIFDLGLTGAVTYVDGETIPAAGVEIGYWPVAGRTFVGRVGVQRIPEGEGSPFTAGFAFWGDDLVLEWAYQSFGALEESTHRFGIRFR